MKFSRNPVTGELECYTDEGSFVGHIYARNYDSRLDDMEITPLIGEIYEYLAPFPGLNCWIGSEYRENKMGKLRGATYVYARCRPLSSDCSGEWSKCRAGCQNGDPGFVWIFLDRGCSYSLFFPGPEYSCFYKRRSKEEFIGILSRCFLARGYHGPVWAKIQRDKWRQRREKL